MYSNEEASQKIGSGFVYSDAGSLCRGFYKPAPYRISTSAAAATRSASAPT